MAVVVSILAGALVFAALIIAGLLVTRREQQDLIIEQRSRIEELKEHLHVTIAPQAIVLPEQHDDVTDDRDTIVDAVPIDLRMLGNDEPTIVSPVSELLGR